ncbi:hypothetical protein N9C68_00515 [Gammaproteobacteria bacterium]|nr:hypothetical protein [Gammaproteobacteria bacterium]
MKNTLALVLMVFGIVGCATNSESGFQIGFLNIEVSEEFEDLWDTVLVKDYDNLNKGYPRTEAMDIKTGKKFHLGKYPPYEKLKTVNDAVFFCNKLYKTRCVTSRINDEVIYRSLDDYKYQDERRLAKAKEISRLGQEKIALEKKRRKANEDYCKNAFDSNEVLKLSCLDKMNWGKLSGEEAKEAVLQASLKEKQKKEKILIDLTQRCEEYGFTGESNISACIQREAQHDKELAMQKYELQKTRVALQQAQSQAQARTYAQSLPPVVEEEEDLPFLIKFLGDVAIGVVENLADPAFQRDMQQQRQINELKANQNRDIYRDCRPNC